MSYLVAFLCVLSFASLISRAKAERRYRRAEQRLSDHDRACKEFWDAMDDWLDKCHKERTDRCD